MLLCDLLVIGHYEVVEVSEVWDQQSQIKGIFILVYVLLFKAQ